MKAEPTLTMGGEVANFEEAMGEFDREIWGLIEKKKRERMRIQRGTTQKAMGQ